MYVQRIPTESESEWHPVEIDCYIKVGVNQKNTSILALSNSQESNSRVYGLNYKVVFKKFPGNVKS